MRLVDRTGERIGRLTVLHRAPAEKGVRPVWVCQCDCGNVKPVRAGDLRVVVSCGCYQREMRFSKTKHGLARKSGKLPPLYRVWAGMKSRCLNPKSSSWDDYGGRGITVCERWVNDYVAFAEDVGPRPSPRHTLDRIDNSGNYEPGNVRWATYETQANNRREKKNSILLEIGGKLVNAAEAARLLNIKYASLRYRMSAGLDPFTGARRDDSSTARRTA